MGEVRAVAAAGGGGSDLIGKVLPGGGQGGADLWGRDQDDVGSNA